VEWGNWLEPVPDLPPELYCAIGRVDQAWARVDFSLRYLLKNLIVPLAPGDRERIAKVDRHADVVAAIREILGRYGHPRASDILAQTALVGIGRSDGAYGQRNDAVHAVYWQHNGTVWRHRIGKDEIGSGFAEWAAELGRVADELAALASAICAIVRPTSARGAPSATAVSTLAFWPSE
jgi:hypothetical protein